MGKDYITPDHIKGEDIKELRKQLGLTQKKFASFVNSSTPTVERWEAGEKEIRGGITLLVSILRRHPELLEEFTVPPKEYPLRMWYMYKDQVCTLIDADESKRKIRIKNFVDHPQFRAFGRKESPDYRDFEELLEGRCFPAGRDKMKLVLKDLDLPFYDPMLIVMKTEGRMAEDDFWLKIEKS